MLHHAESPPAAAARQRPKTTGRAVLATDFDRTLTDADLRPDARALQAVERVRAAGHPCILVTGRPAVDLEAHPGILERFDGVVLEGGAVWGTAKLLHEAPNAAYLLATAQRLREAGHHLDVRKASFTAPVQAREAIARLAPDLSLHANVNQVDVLPPGHDKGTGLRNILAQLGLEDRRVVAVGDGENDVPFFRAADKGIAVANATAPLQAVAAYVTSQPGPAGFVQVAERMLNGGWP